MLKYPHTNENKRAQLSRLINKETIFTKSTLRMLKKGEMVEVKFLNVFFDRSNQLLLISGSLSCLIRALGVSNLKPGVFSTPSLVVVDR